jgi:MFS family permease
MSNSSQQNQYNDENDGVTYIQSSSSSHASVVCLADEEVVSSHQERNNSTSRTTLSVSNDAANTVYHESQENNQETYSFSDQIMDDHENNQSSTSIVPEKSKNINRVLLYTFFSYASRSLWNQSVLSAFVYLLKADDPKFVGIITCVMGVSQLLTSFPAGYLSDKYRRDFMLKIASLVGFIASTLTIIAARMQEFMFLAVALSFWGVFQGISNPSVDALFADSMMDGERSKYFTKKIVCRYLGSSSGPLVALFMFSYLGNEWTIEECQFILCAAQVLSFPALIVLCSLNDDHNFATTSTSSRNRNSIPHDIEDLVQKAEDTIGETHRSSDSDLSLSSDDLETPLLSSSDDHLIEYSPGSVDDENETSNSYSLCNILESRLIPALVAASDMLGALAAGMSVRFFPIFFLDNLKMTPQMVQLIFLCSTIGMTMGGQISQHLGARFGRIETTIFLKLLGASFFMLMIVFYQYNAPVSIVLILFVLRTSIMNSPGALSRSVLMDSVPAEERAKWSSLESVNQVNWAGSAALGGFLVDWKGIVCNFYITATFQVLATTPLFFVLKRFGRVRE